MLGCGSPASEASVAPERCLSLWNADRKALTIGFHSFRAHGYDRAEVMYLDAQGEVAERGRCAVVFPSGALDPEPVAAGKRARSRRLGGSERRQRGSPARRDAQPRPMSSRPSGGL
jgi:hypothetical protein